MIRRLAIAAAAVLAAGAAEAANFDGSWSVLLSTSKGNCDKVYRFPVRVEGGRINYAGQTGATAQGGVTPNGKVTATFMYGQDTLSANGMVRGETGQGNWRSPSRSCSVTSSPG